MEALTTKRVEAACLLAFIIFSACDDGGSPGSSDGGPLPGSPGATVSLEAPGDVSVGTTFAARVVIYDAGESFYAAFDAVFDADILEFVGAEEGTFFNETSTVNTKMLAAPVDGTRGHLVIGITRLGPVDAVAGSGHALTLHFRAVEPGVSTIAFVPPYALRDATHADVEVASWMPVTVTVQ